MRRRSHAAAAVRSGKTVYVIEFGGIYSTILAATTILQMCKYMVGGGGGGGGGSVSPIFDSAPYEY